MGAVGRQLDQMDTASSPGKERPDISEVTDRRTNLDVKMSVLQKLAGLPRHQRGQLVRMLTQFLAYLCQERGAFLMGQLTPPQKCRVAGLDPVRCLLFGHEGVGLNLFLGRGIDCGNCRHLGPFSNDLCNAWRSHAFFAHVRNAWRWHAFHTHVGNRADGRHSTLTLLLPNLQSHLRSNLTSTKTLYFISLIQS